MREIKVRAWDGEKMVEVAELHLNTKELLVDDEEWLSMRQSPLMQFSGIHDNNGREIYESDIVRNPYKYAQPHVSEVLIEGGNTYLSGEDLSTGGDMLLCDYADQCEVIGNIYKNPDLLEDEK